MKTILIFVIFLTSQAAFAFEYSSCQDPNYIQYVAKRLDFYDKVSARSYEEAQEELRLAPFDTLSKSEKTLYLYSNTVLSAISGAQHRSFSGGFELGGRCSLLGI